MSNRAPVPIGQLPTRMTEAGRIRLGVKTGNAMKSLRTFRFTSVHKDQIEQIAQQYGGKVEKWNDPKANPPEQWQVITTSAEIDVYLPTGGLSQDYELWAGGGCTRRCDGESCMIPVQTGPDEVEYQPTPCICTAKNSMECKPITRLAVMMPNVNPFSGLWRVESKGFNALQELLGMVSIIENMLAGGRLVQARLGLVERTQSTPGRKKRIFVVPTLSIPHTPAQLAAGNAEVRAIATSSGPPPRAAIEAAPWADDDGVIDAEIVDDTFDAIANKTYDVCAEHHIDYERFWPALKSRAIDKTDTDDEAVDSIAKALAAIESGAMTVVGFNPDGSIIWKQVA